jgi:3',5'-cyclic AMP phosphodiesterase CpdA
MVRQRFLRCHPPLQGTFAFAAFTDAHFYRPGDNERNARFGELAASLNALQPLFALSLGDQMEISSGATDTEKKWIAEAVREQLDRLHVPLYVVAGNHEVDKTFEGAGTRWYHEQYLGYPPWVSFAVENFLFVGLDLPTPGIYGRDHGGSFQRVGQAAWLAETLRQADDRFTVLWGHMSVFGEFLDSPGRDELLRLLYQHRVRLALAGHIHNNSASALTRPVTGEDRKPPWSRPAPLAEGADVVARLADPASTVFLETTTCSAFLLGGCPYQGWRYIWVRDGAIAWQAVVPTALSVTITQPAENLRRVDLRNGPETDLPGFPLHVTLPPGRVTARAGDRELPVWTYPDPAGQTVWVQVDLAADQEIQVTIVSQPAAP